MVRLLHVTEQQSFRCCGRLLPNRDIGQAGAVTEGRAPACGDAVRDGDARQAGASDRTLMAPMLVTRRALVESGMVTAPPEPCIV